MCKYLSMSSRSYSKSMKAWTSQTSSRTTSEPTPKKPSNIWTNFTQTSATWCNPGILGWKSRFRISEMSRSKARWAITMKPGLITTQKRSKRSSRWNWWNNLLARSILSSRIASQSIGYFTQPAMIKNWGFSIAASILSLKISITTYWRRYAVLGMRLIRLRIRRKYWLKKSNKRRIRFLLRISWDWKGIQRESTICTSSIPEYSVQAAAKV